MFRTFKFASFCFICLFLCSLGKVFSQDLTGSANSDDAVYFYTEKKDNTASIIKPSVWASALGNNRIEKNPVQKVSIKREKDEYVLCIDFNSNFTPHIHTSAKGVKILLTFPNLVKAPKAKRIHHNVLKGCFFEKFAPSSLIFIAALNMPVTFLSKKYSKNSIKIRFKLNKRHTIVLDAGHGGKDSGAQGITGDCEKNITLLMAIKLRNLLLKSGRYKVILTRDCDRFYPVSERICEVEKIPQADLLVSIHTDSNKDRSLRGMSVYTLPLSVENFYDKLPGGRNGRELLLESKKYANTLVKYFPNCCKIKKSPCRSSELKILKVPMMAVLIELGCLSNRIDNDLLHDSEFQEKLLYAILYSLDDFFEQKENNANI